MSLVERRKRGGIGASKKVGALIGTLLLSILNLLTEFWPASSSYSLVRLARELTQRFC